MDRDPTESLHVDVEVRSLDAIPPGYSEMCRICGATPCVVRVRVWHRLAEPQGPRAWRVRVYHLCGHHRDRASSLIDGQGSD